MRITKITLNISLWDWLLVTRDQIMITLAKIWLTCYLGKSIIIWGVLWSLIFFVLIIVKVLRGHFNFWSRADKIFRLDFVLMNCERETNILNYFLIGGTFIVETCQFGATFSDVKRRWVRLIMIIIMKIIAASKTSPRTSDRNPVSKGNDFQFSGSEIWFFNLSASTLSWPHFHYLST